MLYVCQSCPQSFQQAESLLAHFLADHMDEAKEDSRTVRCLICSKRFPLPEDLESHMEQHNSVEAGEVHTYPGGEDNTCKDCGKVFSSKYNLDRHVQLHRGVRYPCALCGKVYSQKYAWGQHMKIAHNKAIPSAVIRSGERTWKAQARCPYCSEAFPSQADIETHMQETHFYPPCSESHSAEEVLSSARVCQLWLGVTRLEEVWECLLEMRSEGLVTAELRAFLPDPQRLYRALYTVHGISCIIGLQYTFFPLHAVNTPTRAALSTATKLTKGSYLIPLPDASIFACGGDTHSDSFYDSGLCVVYRIYPLLLVARDLPPLPARRRYPCGLYYRNYIYVFGGSDNQTMLNTAVRYSVSQSQWSELPSMFEGRCSTTPCLHRKDIYLIGGVPATGGEIYNIDSGTYRRLPIALNSHADTVTVVVNEELILCTLKRVQVYTLPAFELVYTAQIDSDNYVWSHCQPLVYKGEVWFYYWHRQQIAHFSPPSKSFSLLPSLKYAAMATSRT